MLSAKKSLLSICTITMLIFLLTSCGGKKITLNLSYGERTGEYTGEMKDSLPHGIGTFVTQNSSGDSWTYEGEFKNGHFEGEGKSTWESGFFEKGIYKNDKITPISKEKMQQLYSSPDDFKGNCVEFIGNVFTAPEYFDDGITLQMYTDIQNNDNNTIVYIDDKNFNVQNDDYVKINGIVGETTVGYNAFGAELVTPSVVAYEYEIIDSTEAISPTLKTINVGETQTQYGYSVTVQKIEFAEKETRLYVKVENNGTDNFNLYSFNTKVVQNGKQYEEQSNYDLDYPKIQTDLLPGITSEGIIAFPKLDEKDLKIILDCSTNNYSEHLSDYVFKIN